MKEYDSFGVYGHHYPDFEEEEEDSKLIAKDFLQANAIFQSLQLFQTHS
jgi:hypothetical protein